MTIIYQWSIKWSKQIGIEDLDSYITNTGNIKGHERPTKGKGRKMLQ